LRAVEIVENVARFQAVDDGPLRVLHHRSPSRRRYSRIHSWRSTAVRSFAFRSIGIGSGVGPRLIAAKAAVRYGTGGAGRSGRGCEPSGLPKHCVTKLRPQASQLQKVADDTIVRQHGGFGSKGWWSNSAPPATVFDELNYRLFAAELVTASWRPGHWCRRHRATSSHRYKVGCAAGRRSTD
jgi:hypothetical protein